MQIMIAAHKKDGDAKWRTKPYRDAGLTARDQIAYSAFGGHRMCQANNPGRMHELGDQEG